MSRQLRRVEIHYRGEWRFVENCDDEKTANRMARDLEDDHGEPTRVIPITGDVNDQTWRPTRRNGGSDRILDAARTKSSGDNSCRRLRLCSHLYAVDC